MTPIPLTGADNLPTELPAAMARALELARLAPHVTPPNPSVGCAITGAAGNVIGEGATQATGGPHAEVMALRDAAAQGHSTRGATAWVTLEPCSHTGRTGPCSDALAAAGIARVVAAIADPNPLVAGRGFERLRAAGVQVEVGPGAAQAREVNIGFFSRMVRRRPWVRMKIAASLDGTTALAEGTSQWITGAAARADGHAWRARASAVLTGIGTVLEDDPRLDVRDFDTPRQPFAVLVDSRLELPPNARLYGAGRPLVIYAAVDDSTRRRAAEDRGATVVVLPDANGKVDLAAMMRDLAAREVNELHVEAGHKLNGSLLRAGLVDELLVYLAPRLLGPGRGLAAIGPLAALADGVALEFIDVQPVGNDVRLRARVAGAADF